MRDNSLQQSILEPLPSSNRLEAPQASAQAFSDAARDYEAEERANPIMRWMRRESLRTLDAAFGPGDRVLEIGCGPGVEAVHLARRGVEVVAIDPAPGMIATLSGKLDVGGSAHEVVNRVTPLVMSASRLGELIERYSEGYFDGAYSSMGPLNCEPDLRPVAQALTTLIKPGGRLVVSVINRYCLWETAWYLRARRPDLAFRRWGGRAEGTASGLLSDETFTCYYWNIDEIEDAFSPAFRVVRRRGLPWLLPPPVLGGFVRRAPRLFSHLARLDRRWAHLPFAYALGDHVLLEFVRSTEAIK